MKQIQNDSNWGPNCWRPSPWSLGSDTWAWMSGGDPGNRFKRLTSCANFPQKKTQDTSRHLQRSIAILSLPNYDLVVTNTQPLRPSWKPETSLKTRVRSRRNGRKSSYNAVCTEDCKVFNHFSGQGNVRKLQIFKYIYKITKGAGLPSLSLTDMRFAIASISRLARNAPELAAPECELWAWHVERTRYPTHSHCWQNRTWATKLL